MDLFVTLNCPNCGYGTDVEILSVRRDVSRQSLNRADEWNAPRFPCVEGVTPRVPIRPATTNPAPSAITYHATVTSSLQVAVAPRETLRWGNPWPLLSLRPGTASLASPLRVYPSWSQLQAVPLLNPRACAIWEYE